MSKALTLKQSPYWELWKDLFEFMDRNYPVIPEDGYPDRVFDSRQGYFEKYIGTEIERFACNMINDIAIELVARFSGYSGKVTKIGATAEDKTHNATERNDESSAAS